MNEYYLKIELYNPKLPQETQLIFEEEIPLSGLEKVIVGNGNRYAPKRVKRIELSPTGKISLPNELIDSVKKRYKDREEIMKIEAIIADTKFYDEDYLVVDFSFLNRGIIEITSKYGLALPSMEGKFITEKDWIYIKKPKGKKTIKLIDVPTRERYRKLKSGENAEYALKGRSEASIIAKMYFYDNAKKTK
jgi:hypothetical protein